MKHERSDGKSTRVTHTLGTGTLYFGNPNSRAREGDVVPCKDTTVTVTRRINFANDVSSKFVGRDSPQFATRILQGCVNTVPAPRRPDRSAIVDHCGRHGVGAAPAYRSTHRPVGRVMKAPALHAHHTVRLGHDAHPAHAGRHSALVLQGRRVDRSLGAG
jgi:hypothetical protein